MMYRGGPTRSKPRPTALTTRGPPSQSVKERISERLADRFSESWVDDLVDRLLPPTEKTRGEMAREKLHDSLARLAPYIQSATQEKDRAKADLERCLATNEPSQLALQRFQIAKNKLHMFEQRIKTVTNANLTLETREIDQDISDSVLEATKYMHELNLSGSQDGHAWDEIFDKTMEKQEDLYSDEVQRTDRFSDTATIRDGGNRNAAWENINDAKADPEIAEMMQRIHREKEADEAEEAAQLDDVLLGIRPPSLQPTQNRHSARVAVTVGSSESHPSTRQPIAASPSTIIPVSWGEWDD